MPERTARELSPWPPVALATFGVLAVLAMVLATTDDHSVTMTAARVVGLVYVTAALAWLSWSLIDVTEPGSELNPWPPPSPEVWPAPDPSTLVGGG